MPAMSYTSYQKKNAKYDSMHSSFYTDDNEFCYETSALPRICVNPTKIFTSTFKSMKTRLQQYGNPRHIELGLHYFVIKAYFKNDESKKYIVMLDESEWKFWFIHVITQLRKLQTSPKWKQDGEQAMGDNDLLMLDLCYRFFRYLKSSERLFQVPKEFFHELSSCIDTVRPRLPQSDLVEICVDLCGLLLEEGFESTILKMMEESGFLVQVLRCSTMPLDDMYDTHVFYKNLMNKLSFIQNKFKVGQPCGDIMHNILAGKEGHSNPDPEVLNFLQTISQLVDMTDFPLLHCNKIGQHDMCTFCETSNSKHLRLCSGCRQVSYCSKECQRNHWKSHKQICRYLSGSNERKVNIYEYLVERFMIDHRDDIFATLTKVRNETGNKIEELILELDFVPDEFGIPPALSNPPLFAITDVINKPMVTIQKLYPKHIAEQLKSMIRNVKENQILCVYHSKNGCNMVIKDWGSRVIEGRS